MAGDPQIVAKRREEPDLEGKWGLYAPGADRWMPVVYPTKAEAQDALSGLQRAGVITLG
jgi:hypothetical protein